MTFSQKARVFNQKWNDLPRRLGIVLAALVGAFVLGKCFGVIAPLVIGAVLAWLITPFAKVLERAFAGLRLPKKAGAIVAAVLVFLLLFLLVGWIGARIVSELKSLAVVAPAWANSVLEFFEEWRASGQLPLPIASESVLDLLSRTLEGILSRFNQFASSAATGVAKWTLGAAMGLPEKILFVVLTIMATIYMVADRARIFGFFGRWLPDFAMRRLRVLKCSVFRAIGGQIKAALILMGLVAVELTVGFTILKVPYALLLALLIALMDALPIVGVGLFLIPMSIFGLVTGNVPLGVGCAILYGVVIVLRQIVEPRVVSAQLGLYPLVTMGAIYAGLRLIGVVGMLLGPMLAMIVKALLAGESAVEPVPPRRTLVIHKRDKKPPSVGA